MKHTDSHPLARQTVLLNETAVDNVMDEVIPGQPFEIEDWWDIVSGESWMHAVGNFAAMKYGMRSGAGHVLPVDDEVVYGKINGMGHIVHVSELGEPLV